MNVNGKSQYFGSNGYYSVYSTSITSFSIFALKCHGKTVNLYQNNTFNIFGRGWG